MFMPKGRLVEQFAGLICYMPIPKLAIMRKTHSKFVFSYISQIKYFICTVIFHKITQILISNNFIINYWQNKRTFCLNIKKF